MQVRPRRKMQPSGKRAPNERVPTAVEQADAHLGGDERDVVPITAPGASNQQNSAEAQIEPGDEVTPG